MRQREANLPGRIVAGAQIRAARALLSWRRKDLGTAANLHPNAISYWERHDVIPAGALSEPHACKRMREALESAGVVFVVAPGPGAALKPTKAIPRCA